MSKYIFAAIKIIFRKIAFPLIGLVGMALFIVGASMSMGAACVTNDSEAVKQFFIGLFILSLATPFSYIGVNEKKAIRKFKEFFKQVKVEAES